MKLNGDNEKWLYRTTLQVGCPDVLGYLRLDVA